MQPSSSVETQYGRGDSAGTLSRPKWKFHSYHLELGPDSRYAVKDETSVLDPSIDDYRTNVVATAITLTDNLQRKLASGEVSPEEVANRCNAIRKELDRQGVKVYFDTKKIGNQPKIFAKWKFHVNGTWKTDRNVDVPKDILDLIAADERKYFQTAAYRNWFGPRMQHKREQVIGDVLAESYPDAAAATEAGSNTQGEGNMGTHRTKRDALVLATTALATTFEAHHKLPAQLEQYVGAVLIAARGLFAVAYRTSPEDAELRSIVRQGLLQHFAGQKAIVDKLDAVLPEPPAADGISEEIEVTDADFIIGEDDGSLAPTPTAPAVDESGEDVVSEPAEPTAPTDESAEPADEDEAEGEEDDGALQLTEAEKTAIAAQRQVTDRLSAKADRDSFNAEQHYAALLEEVAALATVEELDAYFTNLRTDRSLDLQHPRNQAVIKLRKHIDEGTAGKLSEERLTGMEIGPDLARLFASSPVLRARNFVTDADGRFAARLEAANAEESAYRALCRVVTFAFGDAAPADQAAVERIARHLCDLLFRRKLDEKTRDMVSRNLVQLSGEQQQDKRLVILNAQLLKQVLPALAAQLKQPQE